MSRNQPYSVLLSALILVVLCASPLEAQAFSDQAAAWGLTMPPTDGSVIMGRGGAIADFNNDGLLDAILPGRPGMPYRAFLNAGPGIGMIAIQATGLGICGQVKAMAVADYDNDGDADIFSCVQLGATQLWEQTAPMTFVNVAAAAGVEFTDHTWQASWGDYDTDGNLDLAVFMRG